MLVSVGMPSSETRWRNTPRSRASLRPTDPARSRVVASPKSMSTPGRAEQFTGVSDPRPGAIPETSATASSCAGAP